MLGFVKPVPFFAEFTKALNTLKCAVNLQEGR